MPVISIIGNPEVHSRFRKVTLQHRNQAKTITSSDVIWMFAQGLLK
jgi:hypothetical protein